MRHRLYSRWVPLSRAERYCAMFGGSVFTDSLNGYKILLDWSRKVIAFVR